MYAAKGSIKSEFKEYKIVRLQYGIAAFIKKGI